MGPGAIVSVIGLIGRVLRFSPWIWHGALQI